MADEATVRSSVSISSMNYSPRQQSFNEDVTSPKGPTPGYLVALADGVDVDFSKLTSPGLCYLRNYSDSDFIEWGLYDPSTLMFHPLGEVGPGKAYPIILSRNLGKEYPSTGTGVTGTNTTFRIRGGQSDVPCSIEAFENVRT